MTSLSPSSTAIRLMSAATFAVALSLAWNAQADEPKADPLEGIDRDALNQAIEDYILANPQVIVQSLKSMEERQRLAEEQHRKDIILARKDALNNDPASPVFGNPEGSITIVEFFDYRCGYCRRMVPTMQKLLEENGDLRWVMKEFPILGPESVYASRAAIAAQKQGKYQEFHMALMSDGVSVTNDNVDRIAALIGLNLDQMKADMQSDETETIIRQNHRLAQELGISGTPSFVLGDRFLPGAVPEGQLRDLIESERES